MTRETAPKPGPCHEIPAVLDGCLRLNCCITGCHPVRRPCWVRPRQSGRGCCCVLHFRMLRWGPSAQQSDGLQDSPAPSSVSPRALHTEHGQPVRASGSKPNCVGISCQQGLGSPDFRQQYTAGTGNPESSGPRRTTRSVPGHKANNSAATAGGTASQPQTCPYRGDSSSSEARRSGRRPGRQGKRGAAHPPSSRESTLERDAETDRAPATKFDQWPLRNVVLKRITMAGLPSTFVLEFDWDLCAGRGAGCYGTDNRGTVSSANPPPVSQGAC